MNVKPGIHSLSFERYRSAAGVSKSMLDILAASTPMHLQAYVMSDQEPETPAQRFGTILHRALLEPDTYTGGFHVKPEKLTFTTKAGKAWKDEHADKPVITLAESKQIEAMVSAVHLHPFARRLLHGARPEQSLFVEDSHGTLRKSRLDALTTGNILPDIKTCETAALETFERSVSRYRYHVQAAYYLDNCKLAGLDKSVFFFICVEKSPPYAVRCLQLLDEVIGYGRMLYQRDLQLYRNCVEQDNWPGWEIAFTDCGLPAFEMRQLAAL